MTESPVDLWRRRLQEWALPDRLLEAVPISPYGWSLQFWTRREQAARELDEEIFTSTVVRSLLPVGGSFLDVGAGTGRASVPLVTEGYRLTAVEKNPELAASLAERAAQHHGALEVVEGIWPDVGDTIQVHDVAMCANVVYDVQEIEPFLSTLTALARVGVVVELSPKHPRSNLAPYFNALHRLDRPDGPTYEDFVNVVKQVCGVRPHVEVWCRPGQIWFESWDEILDDYAQRLLLPGDRRKELRELLASEVEEDDGRFYVGSRERTIVTVWWRVDR